jgi:NAD(P)-dependent dehydrogenase (short-subunit alcohol dehydrogenase family)
VTDSSSLDGEAAVVTGAGRGIGRGIALGLAQAGASVALVARSGDELDQTASQVRELGGTALVVPADISEASEIAGAVRRIRDEIGDVSVLINNAAVVWPLGASTSIDPAQWAAAITINVVAAARLSFLLLPAMIAGGWGRIVNVSSGIAASPAGMLRANAYATSKAALEAHTVNLAAELDGTGVTVNAYRPGSVDTAMQAWIRGQDPARIGAELHRRFTTSYQERGLITPQQSAGSLLARLLSDDTGRIWSFADPANHQ